MNQFVDAAIILVTTPLQVGFLVAEKSYKKPIIGHFARAVGSIPVSRPQDQAEKGIGQVCFKGCTVHGTGTQFTSLRKGDKIRPGKSPDGFAVQTIVSDTELIVGDITGLDEDMQGVVVDFDVLRGVDQSSVRNGV